MIAETEEISKKRSAGLRNSLEFDNQHRLIGGDWVAGENLDIIWSKGDRKKHP